MALGARCSARLRLRAVSRVRTDRVFSILTNLEKDLVGAPRGSVFFAHLLIPHSPFVFNSSCEIYPEIASWLRSKPEDPLNTDPDRPESYRRYFAQIECQQTLLKHLFEAIKGLEVWEDATVIVHGDHGARIRYNMEIRKRAEALTEGDFRDAFSTLYAVRTSDSLAEVVDRPLPLQRLLSDSFDFFDYEDDAAPRVYLRPETGWGRLQTRELSGF